MLSIFPARPMKKNRLQSIRIVVATLVSLFLVIFSFLKIYQIALHETKCNHQQLQREMALISASGITDFLSHIAEDVRLLATSPYLQNMDEKNYQTFLVNFFQAHAGSNIRAIFITDENCRPLFSLPENISDYIYAVQGDSVRAHLRKEINAAWYSKVFSNKRNHKELYYSVILPVSQYPQNAGLVSGKKVIGYIGVVASFNWLVEHYVVPLSVDCYMSTWLMDSDGRLLYHSRHPEMVLRSIAEDSMDCLQCHASFNWQKRMLASDVAFGEYTVGDEPRKIMSYVPIQIQNARWTLVISSNLSDVTGVLRSKFTLLFVLVIFILALIVIAFYRLSIKWIHTDEAERLIRQKEYLHLQVCQASKLASVGELVDTVAHEINTPASIIAAQVQVIELKKLKNDIDFSEEIRIIKKQTQRISDYTRRLLSYSHNMPFKPIPCDLPKIMEECLFLLGHSFRARKIRLSKKYASDLPRPVADPSQLEQVFINLLNNAVDAIKDEGEIKIEMQPAERGGEAGISVKISDTGEGIPPEILPEIFNPFFTTKNPGKGTGLGLSISRAIVHRHGGKISVSSEPGKGSEFEVFLPLKSEGDD